MFTFVYRLLPVALVVASTFLHSGCSSNFGFPGVYRINVQQGNIITQEMVDQLKVGMSRRQVRFIMGTPLVEDTFHADRWDYRYLVRNGEDTLADDHLTVIFQGDELVDIEGNMLPAWAKPESEETEGKDQTEDKSKSSENKNDKPASLDYGDGI